MADIPQAASAAPPLASRGQEIKRVPSRERLPRDEEEAKESKPPLVQLTCLGTAYLLRSYIL